MGGSVRLSAFEDDSGVFSRSIAVASVCLRPGGAGPTRVALEVAAEVVGTGEELYLEGRLVRVKRRVTLP